MGRSFSVADLVLRPLRARPVHGSGTRDLVCLSRDQVEGHLPVSGWAGLLASSPAGASFWGHSQQPCTASLALVLARLLGEWN